MPDLFSWFPAVAKMLGGVIVPVISALAAYQFGIWRVRYDDGRQATRQALERLLKPLSLYLDRCTHPVDGLEGFDEDQVAAIAGLLGDHDELLDEELERWQVLFFERRNYNQDMTAREAREFAAAVARRYHGARRRLGLPYDRTKLARSAFGRSYVRRMLRGSGLRL